MRASRSILRIFSIGFLLLAIIGGVQAQENADAYATQDLVYFKEIIQLKMDAVKEAAQQDIALISAKFDGQEKKIDAQNAKIDQGLSLLGTLLSGLGIVLTVFGVLSFITLQAKAKKEARIAALEWFKINAEPLKGEISSLQERLAGLEQQAKESIAKHVEWVEAGALDARKHMQKYIGTSNDAPPDVAAQSALALSEAVKVTKNKTEESYEFSDFANLAFDCFNKGDKVAAAGFWKRAAKHPGASDEEVAISLYNLAVIYRKLNFLDQSISILDSVKDKFLDSSSVGARLYAGKAIISKAYALTDQENFEKASEEYLSFFDWAERYKDDELADPLCQARNGFGFMLLCDAKKNWVSDIKSKKLLEKALLNFEKALEYNSLEPFAIGNVAYCMHLLGASEHDSREKIREALQLGGKRLYTSTLEDFRIHNLPAEDDAFKAILDFEWSQLYGRS